jgi:large-conductance mechanosensitive channel
MIVERSSKTERLEGWTVMGIWTEFKTTILPWIIAAVVVALMISENRRATEVMVQANARLADAIESQGRALDGVRDLLAAQGYTLPPFGVSQ